MGIFITVKVTQNHCQLQLNGKILRIADSFHRYFVKSIQSWIFVEILFWENMATMTKWSVSLYFYSPQKKLWKGNVFTPVCQSVCSQEGCLPQCMLGYTHPQADTPGQTPPWADTSPGQTHPSPVHAGIDTATAADGIHPTGMHFCAGSSFSTFLKKVQYLI